VQSDRVGAEPSGLDPVRFGGNAADLDTYASHPGKCTPARGFVNRTCPRVHILDQVWPLRVYFHIFLKGIKTMKAQKPDLRDLLGQVEDQFVDLWDTMSRLWGISSTMARIHGLLYITGAALSMDDIMDRLAISRGNVSMNLSKLVEWGLVRRVHKRGDRRDYYESLS